MARQKKKHEVSPEKIDKKKYARKVVRELREAIGYHDHRYYVENDPVISDAEYDELIENLVALEEKSPDLWSPDSPTQRVGGEPREELGSIEHPTPMLSLKATYDDGEVRRFVENCRRRLGGLPQPTATLAAPRCNGVYVLVCTLWPRKKCTVKLRSHLTFLSSQLANPTYHRTDP